MCWVAEIAVAAAIPRTNAEEWQRGEDRCSGLGNAGVIIHKRLMEDFVPLYGPKA